MDKVNMETAVKAFQSGEQVMLVEYRASKADTINWRDKQTGRALSAETLRHTLETSTGSIICDERLGDNVKAGERKAELEREGLVKGVKVLLKLTELTTQRGVTSARGSLSLLIK